MRPTLLVIWCFGLASAVVADDTVDYARRIKPVLQARCYACHGALKQEAGLRLDTAAFAIKGGESGAVIKPGDAAASSLWRRVSSTDDAERMPPEGEPLKADEIAALRSWIAQGAAAPSDEPPERDPRDHWAFQLPKRPQVPDVNWGATGPTDTCRCENPIDAFIAAGHQQHGLRPQPAADKRVWLRRVTLDLIGLPPSKEEMDAFVADDSPQAVEVVVTRLLETPHYGERWGRHWMDIWRYSDWWGLGEDARNSQKHIWHWRDWIVESLNSDKGYDQMLREMLAADELYPDDPDRLRAGGFLARQYFKFNRTSWMDETIEHTAKAMLGLTFNCAKCHDHKYDPFSQSDYYRLRAVFEPYQVRLDSTGGQIDFEKDGIPRPFDCNLDAKTYLHIRGDDRNPDTSRAMEPAVPAFLSFPSPLIQSVSLPSVAVQPGLRPQVVQAYLKQAEQRIVEKQMELEAAKKRLAEAEQSAPLPVDQSKLSVTIAEKSLEWALAQPDSIRARADAEKARYDSPGSDRPGELARAAVKTERVVAAAKADEDVARLELDVVRAALDKKAETETKLVTARTALEKTQKAIDEPGESFTSLRGASKALESNLETEDSRLKPFPATSTGRRTALARWITDPRNPLTARVAVNHIWSRHFGRPLVPTVFDFGRKGMAPTHPELLNWLSLELTGGNSEAATASRRDQGWNMKRIHRLIVTSRAYKMTSSSAGAATDNLIRDSDNRFYWRMNPIRMESQIVRDSLLSLAGELDLTMGGPSIPISNETSRRRSLYFVHSNIEHQKFLSMFDDASVLDCYRRAESIVPQQALALENSPLANDAARKLTQRILATDSDMSDSEFVRFAFLTVLGVEATESELGAAMRALTQFGELAVQANRSDPRNFAQTNVVQALLNHNDFVTVR